MLSVYKYTFFLKFLTPATFPVYKGSVLRGAVIANFKEKKISPLIRGLQSE